MTPVAEFSADVEKKHLYLTVALFYKKPCHSQCVASVVARTGENHYSLAWHEPRDDLKADCLGGTLHELNAVDVLGFTSSTVEFGESL